MDGSNGVSKQDIPMQMHKDKLNSTDLDLKDEHGIRRTREVMQIADFCLFAHSGIKSRALHHPQCHPTKSRILCYQRSFSE